MLAPGYDPKGWDKAAFAVKFARHIHRGQVDPLVALHDASSEVFANGVDDKTLWRWLLQEFDLTTRPPTVIEWRTIIDEHYSILFALLVGDDLPCA